MNLPNEVLALQGRVVDVMEQQPYIGVSLHVSCSEETPFCISWYGDSIDDRVSFFASTAEEAISAAHEYLNTLPSVEERERQIFETKLRKLIDSAPAGVDVTLLQTFQEQFASNQITYQP